VERNKTKGRVSNKSKRGRRRRSRRRSRRRRRRSRVRMLLPICLRVRRMGLDKIEKEWGPFVILLRGGGTLMVGEYWSVARLIYCTAWVVLYQLTRIRGSLLLVGTTR
jgi:hypothetical protein